MPRVQSEARDKRRTLDRIFSPRPLRLRSRISGILLAALVGAVSSLAPTDTEAQSLRGSSRSLDIQNRAARSHDFSYLRNASQVERFVSLGLLVRVRPNRDFDLHAVSFPYARPEARLFIERLAGQYRGACGEKLVVTSLTRPQSRQPRNASDRSVHPTGMAIDLRRSNSPACRGWLENVLISLEGQGVLEATRERWPPHYHVALFPQPYSRYVERLRTRTAEAPSARTHAVRQGESLWNIARNYGTSVEALKAANSIRSSRIYVGQRLVIPASAEVVALESSPEYRVRRGDSLWTIARRHGTTVAQIRQANGLSSSRIHPGQVLRVPRVGPE